MSHPPRSKSASPASSSASPSAGRRRRDASPSHTTSRRPVQSAQPIVSPSTAVHQEPLSGEPQPTSSSSSSSPYSSCSSSSSCSTPPPTASMPSRVDASPRVAGGSCRGRGGDGYVSTDKEVRNRRRRLLLRRERRPTTGGGNRRSPLAAAQRKRPHPRRRLRLVASDLQPLRAIYRDALEADDEAGRLSPSSSVSCGYLDLRGSTSLQAYWKSLDEAVRNTDALDKARAQYLQDHYYYPHHDHEERDEDSSHNTLPTAITRRKNSNAGVDRGGSGSGMGVGVGGMYAWNPYRPPRPSPTLQDEVRQSQLMEFRAWIEAADGFGLQVSGRAAMPRWGRESGTRGAPGEGGIMAATDPSLLPTMGLGEDALGVGATADAGAGAAARGGGGDGGSLPLGVHVKLVGNDDATFFPFLESLEALQVTGTSITAIPPPSSSQSTVADESLREAADTAGAGEEIFASHGVTPDTVFARHGSLASTPSAITNTVLGALLSLEKQVPKGGTTLEPSVRSFDSSPCRIGTGEAKKNKKQRKEEEEGEKAKHDSGADALLRTWAESKKLQDDKNEMETEIKLALVEDIFSCIWADVVVPYYCCQIQQQQQHPPTQDGGEHHEQEAPLPEQVTPPTHRSSTSLRLSEPNSSRVEAASPITPNADAYKAGSGALGNPSPLQNKTDHLNDNNCSSNDNNNNNNNNADVSLCCIRRGSHMIHEKEGQVEEEQQREQAGKKNEDDEEKEKEKEEEDGDAPLRGLSKPPLVLPPFSASSSSLWSNTSGSGAAAADVREEALAFAVPTLVMESTTPHSPLLSRSNNTSQRQVVVGLLVPSSSLSNNSHPNANDNNNNNNSNSSTANESGRQEGVVSLLPKLPPSRSPITPHPGSTTRLSSTTHQHNKTDSSSPHQNHPVTNNTRGSRAAAAAAAAAAAVSGTVVSGTAGGVAVRSLGVFGAMYSPRTTSPREQSILGDLLLGAHDRATLPLSSSITTATPHRQMSLHGNSSGHHMGSSPHTSQSSSLRHIRKGSESINAITVMLSSSSTHLPANHQTTAGGNLSHTKSNNINNNSVTGTHSQPHSHPAVLSAPSGGPKNQFDSTASSDGPTATPMTLSSIHMPTKVQSSNATAMSSVRKLSSFISPSGAGPTFSGVVECLSTSVTSQQAQTQTGQAPPRLPSSPSTTTPLKPTWSSLPQMPPPPSLSRLDDSAGFSKSATTTTTTTAVGSGIADVGGGAGVDHSIHPSNDSRGISSSRMREWELAEEQRRRRRQQQLEEEAQVEASHRQLLANLEADVLAAATAFTPAYPPALLSTDHVPAHLQHLQLVIPPLFPLQPITSSSLTSQVMSGGGGTGRSGRGKEPDGPPTRRPASRADDSAKRENKNKKSQEKMEKEKMEKEKMEMAARAQCKSTGRGGSSSPRRGEHHTSTGLHTNNITKSGSPLPTERKDEDLTRTEAIPDTLPLGGFDPPLVALPTIDAVATSASASATHPLPEWTTGTTTVAAAADRKRTESPTNNVLSTHPSKNNTANSSITTSTNMNTNKEKNNKKKNNKKNKKSCHKTPVSGGRDDCDSYLPATPLLPPPPPQPPQPHPAATPDAFLCIPPLIIGSPAPVTTQKGGVAMHSSRGGVEGTRGDKAGELLSAGTKGLAIPPSVYSSNIPRASRSQPPGDYDHSFDDGKNNGSTAISMQKNCLGEGEGDDDGGLEGNGTRTRTSQRMGANSTEERKGDERRKKGTESRASPRHSREEGAAPAAARASLGGGTHFPLGPPSRPPGDFVAHGLVATGSDSFPRPLSVNLLHLEAEDAGPRTPRAQEPEPHPPPLRRPPPPTATATASSSQGKGQQRLVISIPSKDTGTGLGEECDDSPLTTTTTIPMVALEDVLRSGGTTLLQEGSSSSSSDYDDGDSLSSTTVYPNPSRHPSTTTTATAATTTTTTTTTTTSTSMGKKKHKRRPPPEKRRSQEDHPPPPPHQHQHPTPKDSHNRGTTRDSHSENSEEEEQETPLLLRQNHRRSTSAPGRSDACEGADPPAPPPHSCRPSHDDNKDGNNNDNNDNNNNSSRRSGSSPCSRSMRSGSSGEYHSQATMTDSVSGTGGVGETPTSSWMTTLTGTASTLAVPTGVGAASQSHHTIHSTTANQNNSSTHYFCGAGTGGEGSGHPPPPTFGSVAKSSGTRISNWILSSAASPVLPSPPPALPHVPRNSSMTNNNLKGMVPNAEGEANLTKTNNNNNNNTDQELDQEVQQRRGRVQKPLNGYPAEEKDAVPNKEIEEKEEKEEEPMGFAAPQQHDHRTHSSGSSSCGEAPAPRPDHHHHHHHTSHCTTRAASRGSASPLPASLSPPPSETPHSQPQPPPPTSTSSRHSSYHPLHLASSHASQSHLI